MKTKIILLTCFLFFLLSYTAPAQTWTNVTPPWTAANQAVDSLAVYGDNLYAGTFNNIGSVGARVWRYNGTTWSDVSPSWTDNPVVVCMAVYGGNLYAGTQNFGGAQIWRHNGTTWANVSPPWAATNIYAHSMAVYGGNLYAGTVNGGTGAQVWQYNGTNWANVSPPWAAANAYASSMAAYGGNLYAGTLNNNGAQVWQYNGTAWTNVSPGWAAANKNVQAMAVCGGNLYAGTSNSGGSQVWQYNGTIWTNISSGWTAANTAVSSMAAYGGNLYAGMHNDNGGQVWTYNGTTWANVSPPWTADNDIPWSMAVYGANLYAGSRNMNGAAQVWRLFQPTATTWTRTYGGTNAEHRGLVRPTKDGGYVLAGYSASFGSGTYNLWVLKLNGDGSIVWQKSYGGSEQESINSIDQTSDGGYIVAGTTMSFSQGEYAAWILKLDPNGDVQWQKSYGGSVEDWINSIQETSDGGYIAAGGTSSSGAGKYDAWILKLNAIGNIQWQKTYGSLDDDWINQIRQTEDGNYIAAGGTKSLGAGDQDVWLLKLKLNGDIEWEKTYGGAGTDSALSVQETSDHGYIVAGYTRSFGAGKQDVWVLKVAPDGTPQWQKAFGGQEDDAAYSIQSTSDGGYIAAGYTWSFGTGENDAWLLKLDSAGSIQWQKTYGGSRFEYAYSAEQTSDGGYIISGITDSFGVWGNDIWVSKLDSKGTLPGCPMEGISNAVVTDTTVTGKSSAAMVKSTTVSPRVTEATVFDTAAPAIAQCQPAIYVDPGSVDFALIKVGNSSTKIISIFSAGSEDIVLGTLTITSADASQFRLDLDCSGQTLAPAALCSAQVSFHPTSEGVKNANLSIPSNVASQSIVTVPLKGKGVTSSGISLTVPPDLTPLDACSFYQPKSFAWDETEDFKSYEIQFSLSEDFKPIGVKYKTTTPWAVAPSNSWKKVLLLPVNDDVETPIFWRIVGIRSDKTQVISDVFSLLMEPFRPVGAPTITPASRSTLPTLSWKHYCGTKFKATFSNNEKGKKTSLSYTLKDPTDIGVLFTKELTSNQWNSIRKLVGDESGKTITWFVESWDGLKRYSKTETMSFVLTD